MRNRASVSIILALLSALATARAGEPARPEGAGRDALDRPLMLAERALLRGDVDAAYTQFKTVYDVKGLDAEGHFRAAWGLAQCLSARKQWAEAAGVLSPACARWQKAPPEALWLVADCYGKAGDSDKAAAAFKTASVQEGPLAVRAHFRYALCLAESGRFQEADASLKDYVTRVQDKGQAAEALVLRAALNYRLRKFAEASELGRLALPDAPGPAKVRGVLVAATSELAQGRAAEAQKMIDALGKVDAADLTDSLQFVRHLAGVQLGDKAGLDETEKRLRALEQFKDPERRVALLMFLSGLCEKNGQLENALKRLQEALEGACGTARVDVQREMGRLLTKMSRFDEAFAAYERAGDSARIEALCRALLDAGVKQPGRFITSFRLALIHAGRNDFAEAARRLSDGMAGLDDVQLLDLAEFAKGYFLERKGQFKEAVALYERVSLESKGALCGEARRRALLISLSNGWDRQIVEFEAKLPESARPEMGVLELYAIGVACHRVMAETAPASQAALKARALSPLKAVLTALADPPGGGDRNEDVRAGARALFLPALIRFAILAESREDALFALRKFELLAGQAFPERLRDGAGLTVIECLVAAELRRSLGQWFEAADLYDYALKAGQWPDDLADAMRVQLGDCLTAMGAGARAWAAFAGVRGSDLLLKARVGTANAFAVDGKREEALALIRELLADPKADPCRGQVEKLKASIESHQGAAQP